MNLQELKKKYSGQAIPEWELRQVSEPVKKKPKSAPVEPQADE